MLMLLVAVTTMWAGPTDLPQITTDVNNPIYYTIVNTRSSQPGGYMYFAGENIGIKDEQVATIEDKPCSTLQVATKLFMCTTRLQT